MSILDLCFEKRPDAAIRRALLRSLPDVVGVGVRNIDTASGFNPDFLVASTRSEIIEPLKRLFTGPIVIGGSAAGINAREILEYFGLEYAVKGDGERALLEFVEQVSTGNVNGTAGLVVRREGRIVADNPPARPVELDELPLAAPHRHLRLGKYRLYGAPLPVQTKRGCELSCVYCAYNEIEGKTYRLRDPARVAEEVEQLVRKTGMRCVEIVDSTFNIPLDHAKQVLRCLIGKGLGLRLSTMGLNPMAIDGELVDLLKEAGTVNVGVSAEAGCDSMLRSLGKPFTTREIVEAGRLLHRRGIAVEWYLVLGAPGETEETLAQTFATMSEVAAPWDVVLTGVGIRVYKGAPIAKLQARRKPGQASGGFFEPAAFEPEGLSLERIKRLAIEAAEAATNLYVYEEGVGVPFLFRVAFHLLLPRQPLWRGYIWKRRTEKWHVAWRRCRLLAHR